MNKKTLVAAVTILAFGTGAVVWAQTSHSNMNHSDGMNHSNMQQSEGASHDQTASSGHDMATLASGPIPSEPGQGAFAALIEIVSMLRADPETDWNRVNINGLRQHLVDMDMLITNAEVTTKEITGGLKMAASLSGLGGGAVLRMVPAHGPVLGTETGWNSTITIGEEAVVWTVTSDNDAYIIQALGFFGLMTIGDHHQAHHIGMAKGEMVHNH